jgi:hypothetical protein
MAEVNDGTVEKGACDGPAPWILRHHHLMFIDNAYAIVPRKPSGFFFYEIGMVGGVSEQCQIFPEPSVSLEGDVLVVHESFDGKQAAVDPEKESRDGSSSPCIDVLGHESDAYYDATTGTHLTTVFRMGGIAIPEVTLKGRTLRIQGAGCNRTIDLSNPK